MAHRIFSIILTAALVVSGADIVAANNLTIQIKKCPKLVKAGQNLASSLRVEVTNDSDVEVKGVAVEFVLKKTSECPVPNRRSFYSPHYFDGVLLQGGRMSVSAAPRQTVNVPFHGGLTVPRDTPAGRTYFLCAVIYERDKSGQENSCACCPIKVTGAADKAEILRYGEGCLRKGGTLTVIGGNFGPQSGNTLYLQGSGANVNLPVVSWSDSVIVARVPDDPSIQDGRQYFIGIREMDGNDWFSNTNAYISTCPRQQQPVPGYQQVPPLPPFIP